MLILDGQKSIKLRNKLLQRWPWAIKSQVIRNSSQGTAKKGSLPSLWTQQELWETITATWHNLISAIWVFQIWIKMLKTILLAVHKRRGWCSSTSWKRRRRIFFLLAPLRRKLSIAPLINRQNKVDRGANRTTNSQLNRFLACGEDLHL